MNSEDLWRATLHDFNNLLAGLQGVLELSDPRVPMDPRNRVRMEASIEDGKTLIIMARALALGRHPDSGYILWPEWKRGLEDKLQPVSQLFRCPIEVAAGSGVEEERWPAPGLQDWVVAFTRQVLPWIAPDPLKVVAEVSPSGWVVTWLGDAPMPAVLLPDPPPDAPRSISSYWLLMASERLGVTIEKTAAGLVARMERPCGS